jgi:hypothetical protein
MTVEKPGRVGDRVTVTHPMTRASRQGRHHRLSPVDLRAEDRTSESNDLVLRTLMRTQFSAALLGFGSLVGLLGGVLVVTMVLGQMRPDILAMRIGPFPLAWWLLGVTMFPTLLVIAALYLRRIERLEARLTTLTKQPPTTRLLP